MMPNILGFVVLFVVSLGLSLAAFVIINKNLRTVLDDVVKIPDCTTFYSRILVIGLLCIALSSAFGVPFNLPAEAAFMEYVWKVADGLSEVFGSMLLFLAAYLVMITIIITVLRKSK
ncbi:MAG: hypothetical protein C4541_07000 [Candidatus Auribacter fodinae]|jgi:hypothetical protein|uniref:MotA/TolQ/ExbB proton channel domain-containing protein n=1 Tax=Candidatus Auribacter fodinae TaxID=2093366 RepID=A0A3A4R2W7_9BACT|nr:MAG: hypothetical protein C4541_07000 [Candidatus Auribacter fodinae]